MSRFRAWRTFFYAFVLSLCVLGFGCACLVIEYNMQRTTYGQVDFGVNYTLSEGAPRVTAGDATLKIPAAKWVEQVALSPPVRLLVTLWRWENAAAERFWETVE